MRSAGSGHGCQGQAKKNLSLVCNTVGDSATTAGLGTVHEAGVDRGGDEPESRKRKRHHERPTNAERKAEAFCHFRAKADGMNKTAKRAVEMTVYGKRGKPKTGFPRFPQPLEIAKRDSHIPTAPATIARKSGNPKAGFPLSLGCCFSYYKLRKEIPPNAGFPVVQAHRSIGICWTAGSLT